MAKLGTMVDSATIMACRGKIDFYFWKGVPVARGWPKRRSTARSAGEVLSSQRFVAMVAWTTNIATAVEARYKLHMVGQGVTWVDWQRATFAGRGWMDVGQ